eukprot:scaffold242290_cov31-Tisochrysis_lutea.AAC.1
MKTYSYIKRCERRGEEEKGREGDEGQKELGLTSSTPRHAHGVHIRKSPDPRPPCGGRGAVRAYGNFVWMCTPHAVEISDFARCATPCVRLEAFLQVHAVRHSASI